MVELDRMGTNVLPGYQRMGFGQVLTQHCNEITDKTRCRFQPLQIDVTCLRRRALRKWLFWMPISNSMDLKPRQGEFTSSFENRLSFEGKEMGLEEIHKTVGWKPDQDEQRVLQPVSEIPQNLENLHHESVKV
jgi:hypothetical protein